ncbi:MAG: hemolysin family protein, partial [Candidatus Thermoplasmatota archaeon]|nr:hemolysin family protein [Candidatus Thermoplasmatota archaeon]
LMGTTSPLALLVAVLGATLMLLTLGEFVPRAMATVNPDKTARFMAPILSALQVALYPAIWLLERFSSGILRAFGAPVQRRVFLDEEEIKEMVEMGQAQGILEKEEQEMISAVIDFADLNAGDIMVPRTDMVAVEDTATVADIVETIRRTGYSRIPVYHEDIDTVVGVVYGKDLLGQVSMLEDNEAKQVMKQTLFVPETAHLDEVLREMKTRRIHLGIVHDEYGGTAGLVTLEDILEEIVGDIFDEYDPEAAPVEWVDDQTAILDARLDIDEVNDELGTELPLAAPYETLGGYLFHKLGRPGRKGEVVERSDVKFEIERVANRRILRVRASLKDGEEVPDEDTMSPAAAFDAEFEDGSEN